MTKGHNHHVGHQFFSEQGQGKEGQGITHPIEATMIPKSPGLGEEP